MPLVNGRMQNWWNWSAKTLKTGRPFTRFTNGFGSISTRDQLYAFVKHTFPHLDLSNFSCELTSVMPQNKRDLVPHDDYMDDWQLSNYRLLTGQNNTLEDAGKILSPQRSILNGSTIRKPLDRGSGTSDRLQRLVSII